MSRKLTIVIVVVLLMASFPAFKTSAESIHSPIKQVAAQAAAACANADLMTGIGKDLGDLATTFKSADMKDVVSTSQAFLALAATRQKYENMTTTPECFDLQLSVIDVYSNASDILALALAVQTDPTNAAAYGKAVTDQLTRFQNSMTNLTILAGVATPVAGGTPVGRTSQITSTTCADATFLSGLGTDFSTLGTSLSGTDMKSMGAISQTLLGTIVLRQKYEDLVAPSGCEITQLTAIIAFANTTDLLGLTLAASADTKNADAYTKVLTNQGNRVQQYFQLVLQAAGVATPAPTAAK